MVLCDAHTECVNEFGSYSCHCIHGYREVPHGPGASVCVASAEPGKRLVVRGLLTGVGDFRH